MSKRAIVALFIITTFKIWFTTPSAYAQENPLLTQAFILLTPAHANASEIEQIQSVITENGGRVTHTFPYQAVIAQVSPHTIQQLLAMPAVINVFTQPVALSMMDTYGPGARRLATIWNNLIAPQPAPVNLNSHSHPEEEHNDAMIAPDRPAQHELGAAGAASITPGYYQTSEFMAGSVAVGVVLVESNGATDPSTENWTEDEKLLVFSEIVAALNWWADMEPRANLNFVYDDNFSTPLPTNVEPITRPYSHQQYWIADAMGALGYNASSYFTQVRDYNNNLRSLYNTNWAFTIFVVDSSNDTDNRFSDSFFAYAYLGGPFTVMTYGNNGYGPHNMDAVAAHEIGHIFYALDQYYSAYQSCTRRSGYLYVDNQNSQYGSCSTNVTSIMRGQVFPFSAHAIDTYAAGQLGWRDSDNDNILDPLDTGLPVSIETATEQDNQVTISGSANITPYPSPTFNSVTINTLTNVRYRINGGPWQAATAGDGAFDATSESYQFTTAPLAPGQHTLEVAAIDSAGNESDNYATQTITILDPVDGGLNTEFDPPHQSVAASGGSTTVSGVAYHMENGAIAQVEYRIDGSPWHNAAAHDGAFDSNNEPFSIIVDTQTLEPGTHVIEARATDTNGNVETNVAQHQIEVTDGPQYSVFIPIVANGM